ncbi:MAG: hypothetical protein ABSH16_12790 [Sedimentisphaerales bacterium]
MATCKTDGQGDNQQTHMAGEFLVVGQLFKRGYQVAITMGNAKAIDSFAHNPRTGETFNIQVKALRYKNCFDLKKEDIQPDYVYIFVFLNAPSEPEDFLILRGQTILDDIDGFYGAVYRGPKKSLRPTINYGPLMEYKDNWKLFEE